MDHVIVSLPHDVTEALQRMSDVEGFSLEFFVRALIIRHLFDMGAFEQSNMVH